MQVRSRLATYKATIWSSSSRLLHHGWVWTTQRELHLYSPCYLIRYGIFSQRIHPTFNKPRQKRLKDAVETNVRLFTIIKLFFIRKRKFNFEDSNIFLMFSPSLAQDSTFFQQEFIFLHYYVIFFIFIR
jgi:hypothetical protein